MKIGGTEKINYPAQQAFETLRDKHPELVPYMPNIASITVIERRDEPPLTRYHTRWQAAAREMPAALRSILSEDLLGWHDYATWDAQKMTCEWRIESIRAKDIFVCSGLNRFEAMNDGNCIFTVQGDLTIHAEKVPGVPSFLARTLRDPIEKFVAHLIEPNLTRVAGALREYLDAAKDARAPK